MVKPVVFISHINEEQEIAKKLKEYLDEKFLSKINIFVSSHEESIKLGEEWMNIIKQHLKESCLEIVLCSPYSVKKPWINFEAGACWIKDSASVIPLCHSGLKPGELPFPLKILQGAILNTKEGLEQLLNRISETCKISKPIIEKDDFL